MKYSRVFLAPLLMVVVGISLACSPALCAQVSDTNECCLKLALSNDIALLNIENLATNINTNTTAVDLFYRTNLSDSQGWMWLFRCGPGQTNLALSNLPPDQGFFMVGVTNATRLGFDTISLPREDDSPSTNAPLPFVVNFFGANYTNIWVNNNGNVTFDGAQSAYTPSALNSLGIRIIAPFWADVDTDNADSDVVKFGTSEVDGHAAFGVDWINVGYYASHADKLLSCQLVLIDRSDILPGDFDMEFNYIKVQWERGDVSPGSSAHAGFSDVKGGTNSFELPGSGVSGAFLDTNTVTGLIYNKLNSPVPGRYVFYFRDGQPLP